MTRPRRADDRNDDAVEHVHDGSTFDAGEGDPDGAAFAGAGDEQSASDDEQSASDDEPREHGYGYE